MERSCKNTLQSRPCVLQSDIVEVFFLHDLLVTETEHKNIKKSTPCKRLQKRKQCDQVQQKACQRCEIGAKKIFGHKFDYFFAQVLAFSDFFFAFQHFVLLRDFLASQMLKGETFFEIFTDQYSVASHLSQIKIFSFIFVSNFIFGKTLNFLIYIFYYRKMYLCICELEKFSLHFCPLLQQKNYSQLYIFWDLYRIGGIAREKRELFHFHRRKGNLIKKCI